MSCFVHIRSPVVSQYFVKSEVHILTDFHIKNSSVFFTNIESAAVMNNTFTYLAVSNINLAITEAYATRTRMKYLVQNNRARAEQVDGHSRP